MTAIAVSDDTFEQEVLQSKEPVLVDFYTTWCAPCKAMAPALDEAAKILDGKVKVVKVDTGQSPAAKDTYGIRSIPTLMLFKDGKLVARHLGALVRKEILLKWVNDWVNADETAPTAPRVSGFKLTNGMDVVVAAEERSPFVTQFVYYKVGAADAPHGSSGLAGFVERMTSKSIAKIGTVGPNQVNSRRHAAEGPFGEHDVTIYYRRIDKDELKSAMEAEVDRMTHLRLTDEDVAAELKSIEEELSRISNHPHARLERQMNAEMAAVLYCTHPYGIPAIGLEHERAKLSREDALRFHERYYAPNNAVLVVAGDVTLDEVRLLAEETYGKIPAKHDIDARSRPQDPVRASARRVMLKDQDASFPAFRRVYSVPSFVTATPGDEAALDVLGRILTPLLHGRLAKVSGSAPPFIMTGYHGFGLGAGVILVRVETKDGDPGVLEAGVDAVLDDIRKNGISGDELQQGKRSILGDYEVDNQDRRARRYGGALALGRAITDVDSRPEAISKLTVEDIKRVAYEYLDPHRSVTGWLCPERQSVETAGDKAA